MEFTKEFNLTSEQADKKTVIEEKQRALERTIQHHKERLHYAKTVNDLELEMLEKLQIRKNQGKLRALVSQHDFLSRDYSRESFRGMTVSKVVKMEMDNKLKKLNDSRKPKPLEKLRKDLIKAYTVLDNEQNVTRDSLQKLFSKNYDLGKLPQSETLGIYSGDNVTIPSHMLSYILAKHRNQITLVEMLSISEAIQKPDILSEDIKGVANSFNLIKKISTDRYIDAVVTDKNGQVVTHFMMMNRKKGTKKINKIKNSDKNYDMFNV